MRADLRIRVPRGETRCDPLHAARPPLEDAKRAGPGKTPKCRSGSERVFFFPLPLFLALLALGRVGSASLLLLRSPPREMALTRFNIIGLVGEA